MIHAARSSVRSLPRPTKHPRSNAVEFEDRHQVVWKMFLRIDYEDQPLQLEHDPHVFQKPEISPEPGQRGISPLSGIRNSMKTGERHVPSPTTSQTVHAQYGCTNPCREPQLDLSLAHLKMVHLEMPSPKLSNTELSLAVYYVRHPFNGPDEILKLEHYSGSMLNGDVPPGQKCLFRR